MPDCGDRLDGGSVFLQFDPFRHQAWRGMELSQHLIKEYRAELDRLRAVSGSNRESVLRGAFKDLLKRWGKAHDLQFIAERDLLTKQMTRIYVDGALLHGLRVPIGYWEAKDANDDLDKEIERVSVETVAITEAMKPSKSSAKWNASCERSNCRWIDRTAD